MIKKFLLALMIVLTITSFAYATQPLITDTAVTEGKGNVKLEVGANYIYDKTNDITTKSWAFPSVLSIGMLNNLDFVAELPYYSVVDTDIAGLGDVTLKLKWALASGEGWALSLKPQITLPSSDKDLGNEELTYGMTAMLTKDFKPLLITINGGYYTVTNEIDTDKDVLMASIAGELGLTEKLKAVAEIGIIDEKTFGTGGLVWTASKNVDISLAARTAEKADFTGLAGLTVRF